MSSSLSLRLAVLLLLLHRVEEESVVVPRSISRADAPPLVPSRRLMAAGAKIRASSTAHTAITTTLL